MAKTEALQIQISVSPDMGQALDDLCQAVEQSPDPRVAKRFLNQRFRFLDRLDELIRLEARPAGAGNVTLHLRKTDLYRDVVTAVRTGDFDSLLI